jgi:hypothetical protein
MAIRRWPDHPPPVQAGTVQVSAIASHVPYLRSQAGMPFAGRSTFEAGPGGTAGFF